MDETLPDTPPSVYVTVAHAFEMISEVAYQKMGLRKDPLTGKIVRQLDEARTAIDLAAHLADVLDPSLDSDDRRTLQGLVRDLKMNYVRLRKDADA